MSGRGPYTAKEDAFLVQYIAEARPTPPGRQGNAIYRALVEDPKKWPWGQSRSWQSWRERYKTNKEEFDMKIRRYQKRKGVVPDEAELRPSQKTTFTEDEDKLLMKFLAKYNPQLRGRNGNAVYKMLVDDAEGKWKWHRRHSWQSWRNRYVVHQARFDREISEYQKRHGIEVPIEVYKAYGSQPPRKKRRVSEEADSQEEKWARINWPTPTRGGGLKAAETDGQKEDKKVDVSEVKNETGNAGQVKKMGDDDREGERRVDACEPRQSEIGNAGSVKDTSQNQSNVGDDADDSSDEDKPINSEDYDGEIFPTSDEDEDIQNGSVDEDDTRSNPRDDGESGDENGEMTPRVKGDDEVVVKRESVEAEDLHQLNEKSPERGPDIKEELPEPTLDPPPLPKTQPPVKFQPSVNRHDFALSSQSRFRQSGFDDDPFIDSVHSPGQRRPLKKKRPPTLVESPFGNKINGGRARRGDPSSTEESDAEVVWPPVRATAKDRAQAPAPGNSPVRGSVTEIQQRKGKGKAVDHGQAGATARRVASSSRRSPEEDTHLADDETSTKPSFRRQQTLQRPRELPIFQARKVVGAKSISTRAVKRRRTEMLPQPTPTSTGPKRYSTGDIIDSASNQKTTATITRTGSRTINLRQELANKHLQSTQRSSSRRSSGSPVVLDEDFQVFQQLGIQQAVRNFSEKFGFTENVVQKLWEQLKSLRLVEDLLSEMRNHADRVMNERIDGALMPPSKGSGSAARPTPTSVPKADLKKVGRRSSVSTTSGGRGKKSLEIRLVDSQEEMELEYEPLSGTRAGKFTRLVKMGREDEALEREQRRVSSIALSPRRDLQQQQQQQQQQREELSPGDMEAENEESEVTASDDVDRESDEGSSWAEVSRGGKRADDVGEESDRADDAGEESDSADDQEDEHEDQAMEVDSDGAGPTSEDEVDEHFEAERLRESEHEQETASESENEAEPEPESAVEDKQRERQLSSSSGDDSQDEDEDMTTVKSEASEEVEMQTNVKSDAERWKEIEHLFWAANHHNAKMLREIEATFDPGFLLDWLSNYVALK